MDNSRKPALVEAQLLADEHKNRADDAGRLARAVLAALSASPAEKPPGREALTELEHLAATFGDMARLGLADRDISGKEVGILQFAEGAVRDAIARLATDAGSDKAP